MSLKTDNLEFFFLGGGGGGVGEMRMHLIQKTVNTEFWYSSCIIPHRNWFWFAAVEAINTHEILQVVQLTKFDYRLANDLDEELQKLRCRVNNHALRFTKPILELGQRLVFRMQQMAKRFIAIHLRFVPVTLSFCE